MRRTLSLLACLSACLLAVPAAASAQGVLTPPGASGVDEYSETIPSADGNRTIGAAGDHHALTSRQRRALEQLGPDGKQAAALADATGPSLPAGAAGGGSKPGSSSGSPDSPPAATRSLPDAHGDSGIVATVTRALGGSGGGIGAVLPVLLLVTALGAAFVGVRRRPAS